ncbi:sulfatase family protein [Parapedobacter indicus]|uniref:Arylsulfatase A n=1 Tax=Parapedobacter indicus TaxID=1477437 RepID=A0A1I3NBK5_9SPHI|nr:sulfatase-like hydrolase/transferase [Parapedobacter indicus]PPL00942.1 arylsulfatase A-like enzyme [Parapedobacter indicus]SFJ06728.1 Arylsulfatase A [Parapedobacter indicus]
MKSTNAIGFGLLLVGLLIRSSAWAQEQPNIIVILTDDMGFSDIGAFGGNFVPTPRLDRFAQEGTRFTQYYSASPICSPSRTSILTGMFPSEWNFTTFLNNRRSNELAEQANYLNVHAPSLARVLKDAGYATGHFGKWHMGGGRDIKNAPKFKKYGFDEHASTYESPEPDPALTATDWIWSEVDSVKRWNRTAYFVDKTLDFLRRHRGTPCFVNLWPDDMHTPWVPEENQRQQGEFPMDPAEEATFKLVLAEFDRQLGRLFDGLEELGVAENTLVIFTSDNGPLPSFRGSRAGGLRGTKLSLYEGGIRMPFIVRWPGRVRAGGTDSISVLNSTDLFPTLAGIASAELPANYKGDGEDRAAVWLGTPASRDKDMYWEYGRNDYAFNYPQGKDRSPNLAIRSGKWKLLIDYHKNDPELYDMEQDRYETTDLAEAQPDIVKELRNKLITWRTYLPELTAGRANPPVD